MAPALRADPATRRNRIRPMPFLSSWAATTTRALFQVPAASPSLYATHIGFIYFDLTGKAVTAGPHHRATELVQPSPSRLVTAIPSNAAGPGH